MYAEIKASSASQRSSRLCGFIGSSFATTRSSLLKAIGGTACNQGVTPKAVSDSASFFFFSLPVYNQLVWHQTCLGMDNSVDKNRPMRKYIVKTLHGHTIYN
jgi:hypothetical protein